MTVARRRSHSRWLMSGPSTDPGTGPAAGRQHQGRVANARHDHDIISRAGHKAPHMTNPWFGRSRPPVNTLSRPSMHGGDPCCGCRWKVRLGPAPAAGAEIRGGYGLSTATDD